MSPQAESAKARHSTDVAAKRRRPVIPSRLAAHPVNSATRHCRYDHDPLNRVVIPSHVLARSLGSSRRACCSKTGSHRAFSGPELISTKHFNLPHQERLDSRAATRLDIATETNPSIFEGLRRKAGRLEGRYHAP